jgi:hypothetical protein
MNHIIKTFLLYIQRSVRCYKAMKYTVAIVPLGRAYFCVTEGKKNSTMSIVFVLPLIPIVK